MPSESPPNGIHIAGPLGPLALRLRTEEPIDPASVWGRVAGAGFAFDSTAWIPANDADSDGWVVAISANGWPEYSVLTFTAGAKTVSGGTVGPVSCTFHILDASSAAKANGGSALAQPGYDEFNTSALDLTAESNALVRVVEVDDGSVVPRSTGTGDLLMTMSLSLILMILATRTLLYRVGGSNPPPL